MGCVQELPWEGQLEGRRSPPPTPALDTGGSWTWPSAL